jgi:hypothetical protein
MDFAGFVNCFKYLNYLLDLPHNMYDAEAHRCKSVSKMTDCITWCAGPETAMRYQDDALAVKRATALLFKAAPNALLGRLARVPKSTAISWRRARRRPPVPILRLLSNALQQHGAECFSVQRELDILIGKRMGEPPLHAGFFVVNPVTGQNRQNRAGRPKRKAEG